MGLRYSDLSQLRGSISPDVIIEGEDGKPQRRPPAEGAQGVSVAPSNRKILEDRFMGVWQQLEGPELVREHRFHATRRWRFDFAYLQGRIAFEIQGGIYSPQSGHRSFEGVQRDYEKINAAQLLGWQVFQLTSGDLKNLEFMQQLVDYTLAQEGRVAPWE